MEILLSEVEETDEGLAYRSFYTEVHGAGVIFEQDELSYAVGSIAAVFFRYEGVYKGTLQKITHGFHETMVRDDEHTRKYLTGFFFPYAGIHQSK
jgi:hypothetical protein